MVPGGAKLYTRGAYFAIGAAGMQTFLQSLQKLGTKSSKTLVPGVPKLGACCAETWCLFCSARCANLGENYAKKMVPGVSLVCIHFVSEECKN